MCTDRLGFNWEPLVLLENAFVAYSYQFNLLSKLLTIRSVNLRKLIQELYVQINFGLFIYLLEQETLDHT